MKKLIIAGLIAAPMFLFSAVPSMAQDAAATTCKDGTASTSSGRGACSGHGGVQKGSKSSAGGDSASPAPAPVNNAAPAPAVASSGATMCKDGSTSAKSGRGACSGHGGVDKGSATSTPANAGGTASGGLKNETPEPTGTAAKSSVATKSASVAPTNAGGTAPTPVTAGTSAPTGNGSSPAGNTSSTGATAKCKDGTFSKSQHHSGTCSNHGGVAEWLDGSSK